MAFDIAVGVNGQEFNTAAKSIYDALYPKVFTGETQAQYSGISFHVAYDVQVAPEFDFTSVPHRSSLVDSLRARAQREAHGVGEIEPMLGSLAATLSTLKVTFPMVALTFTNGTPTVLTLPITAFCHVQVSGSTIAFVPYQVTAPPQNDVVTNWLVQNVVVPLFATIVQTLLSGLTIPPIKVEGVALSTPSVGIVNGVVIA